MSDKNKNERLNEAALVTGEADEVTALKAEVEMAALKAEVERMRAELSAAKSPSHPHVIAVGSEWLRITNDGILIPDSGGKALTGVVSIEEMTSAGVSIEAIERYKKTGILVKPDFAEPRGWKSDGRPAPESGLLVDGEKLPVGQNSIGGMQRIWPNAGGVYA